MTKLYDFRRMPPAVATVMLSMDDTPLPLPRSRHFRSIGGSIIDTRNIVGIVPRSGESVAAASDIRRSSAMSFEAEVQPHLRTLYHGAYSLTRDAESANHLLQDALERGYQKLDHFQPGTNLCAWLLRIMRNVWISRHRREAGAPYLVSLDDVDEVSLHRRAARFDARSSEVETCVIDQLGEDSILAAIESLPRILRDVVVLADVQAASYGSIAERLEIPLGSVASRLFRARRRLQRTLGEQASTREPLERAG